jgi:HPt (histidine-containing phosphotransfer) domain-containing protein
VSAENAAVLDLGQLRDACMEDQELMRELVASLIDDTTTQLRSLQAAIEIGDCADCKRVVHYIKGACANLGADSMVAALFRIEQQAVQGDFATCRSTLDTLALELQKLRIEATSL